MSDQVVIDGWWQSFVATGRMPSDLELVQERLIRAVHKSSLPSVDVHIKSMTFPRAKDRLRYAFRAMPASHEASMLAVTARAGILCPPVLAVHTQRYFGLPHRSLLVLQTLPSATSSDGVLDRMQDEIDVAVRLLRAGIYHRDLHRENFVRTESGELAVLDMQSASRISQRVARRQSIRFAVAAKLLRHRPDGECGHAVKHMCEVGLLENDIEVAHVTARAGSEDKRYESSRIGRCLTNSTEFERRLHATGIEYRHRGDLPHGRWWSGPSKLRRAWLGQRAKHLAHAGEPVFAAFFQKWWWLGGGCALYVPSTCADERIDVEVSKSLEQPLALSAVSEAQH